MSRGLKLCVAVSLCAFASVFLAASGRAEPDTAVPVLHAFGLPASIETTATGADVVATARITDDLSGVAAGRSPTCFPPGGLHTQMALKSASATVFVGEIFEPLGGDEYSATLRLPPYAQTGTWTLERVILTDCAGNSRTLSAADVAAAGFPTSVQITGAGDATPPALSTLSISPPTVDTSAGAVDVTVTATIVDDLSGVAASDRATRCGDRTPFGSSVSVSSPSGSFGGGQFEPLGGNAYAATVRVPHLAPRGTWQVTVGVSDCARNSRGFSPTQLAVLGFPSSFEVTSAGDETAPVITGLAIAPDVVDTRAAGTDVVFTARLSDDLSGVSVSRGCGGPASQVLARSPAGAFRGGVFEHVAGDEYRATVPLERFADPGVWSLRLILSDCVGNSRHLVSADLESLGLPPTFRVLPPLYDFGGFMAPLGDDLAHRKPGSGMAVKFRLGGAAGTAIFDPGFPQVQAIDCATRTPVGEPVSLGATEWVFQSLTDGLYQYKWKSSPEWRNVCRRLILGFDDGSRHAADVHFR
jgi:hypothetical protein